MMIQFSSFEAKLSYYRAVKNSLYTKEFFMNDYDMNLIILKLVNLNVCNVKNDPKLTIKNCNPY